MDDEKALVELIRAESLSVVREAIAKELAQPSVLKVGVGAPGGPRITIPKETAGLGCPNGEVYTQNGMVAAFLEAGSARLAWAKARGIPFAPYKIVINANFPTTTTTLVTDQGNKEKLVQDTWIKRITYRVYDQNTPATQFSSLADFFYSYQSGLQATLKVVGTPKYMVVPDYTPLDQIESPTDMWILQLTNGLKMDFQSTITLPNPVTIAFTFHGISCPGLELVNKSQDECLRELNAMGYDTGCYAKSVCSR